MQIGFYFDQTRCIGCFTCTVACKDWNDIAAGPEKWRRVTTIETGRYPDLFVAFMSAACYHCATPACVSACPTAAITKRKLDGVVVVEQEACLGKEACSACLDACPYGAPQFGIEQDAKMRKCNLCLERLNQNKRPVCVDACPMRALDAGPIQELRLRYGDTTEAPGFVYHGSTDPSVTFKAKLAPERLGAESPL